MKGTVVKYYSVTSGSLEYCLSRLLEVKEKHPDRDYILLRNMRNAYSNKVTLAQRVEIELDFPMEDELDLPAPVARPPGIAYGKDRASLPAWQDYERDQERRKKIISEAQEPAKKLLKEPLNPSP